MNFLVYAQLILQFLPAIFQIVMAIETAFKGAAVPVSGPAKKTIALDLLTAGPQPIAAEHVDLVGKLVDTVVGSLNKTGVFTKGA
jgi:hypothetical protein